MLSLYPEDDKIPAYQRRNGLTAPILESGFRLILDAFKSKNQLTYKELGKALADSGIPELGKVDVRRHIIRRAGRKGIICFSGHTGRQQTFMLLESTIPKPPSRSAVLARLAKVYFESHGPATVRDFAWWAGIKMGDAKSGLEAVSSDLREDTLADVSLWMPKRTPSHHNSQQLVHLLPAFDEYLIAYQNRSAILEPRYAKKVMNGSTLAFLPTILSEGRVIGTWRPKYGEKEVTAVLHPFTKLSEEQNKGAKEAAEGYSRFIEKPVKVR